MADSSDFSFGNFLGPDNSSLSSDVDYVLDSKEFRDSKIEDKVKKARGAIIKSEDTSVPRPVSDNVEAVVVQPRQQQVFVPVFTPIHVMTDEERQARHDAREREMLERREQRQLQREAERKAEEERLADPKRWTPEERYRARKASVEKALPVIAASIHDYFMDCPYDSSVVGNAVDDLRNDDLPTNFNIYSKEYREWTHTVKFAEWCDKHNIGYNPESINWSDGLDSRLNELEQQQQTRDTSLIDISSADLDSLPEKQTKGWFSFFR